MRYGSTAVEDRRGVHRERSLLEYEAILHPDLDRRNVRTILELGPGYGRTAYVFLTLQPGCRYIVSSVRIDLGRIG